MLPMEAVGYMSLVLVFTLVWRSVWCRCVVRYYACVLFGKVTVWRQKWILAVVLFYP
jgi:hypothetical protein